MPETNGHNGTSAGNGGTGGNGGGAPGESKLAAVLAEAKAVQARAVDELKETVKAPHKTDVWKSILRVKHDETPRSRALGVLSNVFLHLHPAKINRDAVAYNYTWGMGGAFAVVWVACRHEGSSAPDDGAGSVKLARFAFGPPVEAAQVHHRACEPEGLDPERFRKWRQDASLEIYRVPPWTAAGRPRRPARALHDADPVVPAAGRGVPRRPGGRPHTVRR